MQCFQSKLRQFEEVLQPRIHQKIWNYGKSKSLLAVFIHLKCGSSQLNNATLAEFSFLTCRVAAGFQAGNFIFLGNTFNYRPALLVNLSFWVWVLYLLLKYRGNISGWESRVGSDFLSLVLTHNLIRACDPLNWWEGIQHEEDDQLALYPSWS